MLCQHNLPHCMYTHETRCEDCPRRGRISLPTRENGYPNEAQMDAQWERRRWHNERYYLDRQYWRY